MKRPDLIRNLCSEVLLRDRFSKSAIKWEALIDALGGREWLELWINATDFAPLYHPDEGLLFTFKIRQEDKLKRVKLIPMAHSTTSDSFYVPSPTYDIKIIIEEINGWSLGVSPPYRSELVFDPAYLTRTFERTAQVAINF
jgi:hypothetical protein